MQGREVAQRFATLMDQRAEPIYAADVQQASALADQYTGLDARDLLHIAVMTRLGTNVIISADRGFDGAPSLVRRDPLAFETWRATITGESDRGADA